MVQTFDPCRKPVAVRSEDEVYDSLLFLAWREQLLLDSFVAACAPSMIARCHCVV
jgi:hypothetical protein